MRSSDQRYFDVRRVKRPANLYPEIGPALSAARRDPDALGRLYELIGQSAHEFTHVMLACGRTANDFRRNFRRGPASHNIVTANEIAPIDALLAQKLDGYSVLRLSKEQHWNVKERFGKLRPQDRLLHDPQGQIWFTVILCAITGTNAQHVGILDSLRENGRRFDMAATVEDAAHMEVKRLQRTIRAAKVATADFPAMTDTRLRNLALRKFVRIRKLLDGQPDHITLHSAADARVELEKCLVAVEAYVDARDVRMALCDPDTSQRHCSNSRVMARLARIEDRLIELGDCDQRYYTPVNYVA